MKTVILSKLSLCFFLVVSIFNAQAGWEPERISDITGAAFGPPAASMVVFDNTFLDPLGMPNPSANVGAWHLRKAKNEVTFRINQNTIDDCSVPQFTTTVDIVIEQRDEYGNTLPTLTKQLEVEYDNTLTANYKEKHSFIFENAYWVKVTVQGIPLYADYVILESTINLERYQDIDLLTYPSFNAGAYNAASDLLTVSWTGIDGAEEFYMTGFENVKFTVGSWLPGQDAITLLNDGSVRVYGNWSGNNIATKKPFSLDAYHYFDVKDGKIIASGDYFDATGMMVAVQPDPIQENVISSE
jgi:hypothetical protein